jgi:hypothetical protein
MTDRRNRRQAQNGAQVVSAVEPLMGETIMKSTLLSAMAVLMLIGVSSAKELPDAPSAVVTADVVMIESSSPISMPKLAEKKPIDATFVSLALISTGSTFADSYTTLFARQNWLAGKKGVCNMEVQSAYLYGTHPTLARAYAVASAKSAGSLLAAYYLRKHHSKFWSAPLVMNSIISLEGVTQNMIACN